MKGRKVIGEGEEGREFAIVCPPTVERDRRLFTVRVCIHEWCV